MEEGAIQSILTFHSRAPTATGPPDENGEVQCRWAGPPSPICSTLLLALLVWKSATHKG